MRVLHVITGLNVGGAETMLARLLERRALFPDIEPAVATLIPAGFTGARVRATGVPIHELGLRHAGHAPSAVARLAALLRRAKPDVIMAWMHHAQLAATLARAVSGARAPVIWNVRHSLGAFGSEKPATRAILRVQARLSATPAAVIYNSHAAKAQYEAFGFRNARVEVLSNGFPRSAAPDRRAARARLVELFDVPPARFVVGTVARAHPMKDVPNLLAAFARVLDAGVDAHLVLAGEGMDRATGPVEAALTALPRDRWSARGQRSDVADWLAGLDTLVLPSAWGEGFPNILGEGMLAGVPCIATDVGDSRMVVGDTGRVVQARDPDALAAALLDLADLGEDARRAVGLAARRRIEERFDLDEVAGRYAALCRSVAASATRRNATPSTSRAGVAA